LEAISRRLKHDKRGISNVIVVMLSLVLIVIIVSNVVLWSYQMNQLDLERTQENLTITDVKRVTRSSWFTTESEFEISVGSRLSGTFTDTKALSGSYETFSEATDICRLEISNNITMDLPTYPMRHIQSIEILTKYNVTENSEKWFLRAYNWTATSFGDAGFNNTDGSQPVQNEWNEYSVSILDEWADYVNSKGALLVQFSDEGTSANQTLMQIDFFSVRAIIDGAQFDLKNSSPMTTHIVATWIINSTNHQRYSASFFINSGEEATYLRTDIKLPQDKFIAKIVTEKGNIVVYS
jgi:hypothetical protein